MDSFGERLRSARESRGLSIQNVAETLGVDSDRLRALERNEFRHEVDEAAMMAALHAYAECLDADAELMIEDYVRERDRCLRDLEATVAMPAAAVETAVPATEMAPEQRCAEPPVPAAFPRWFVAAFVLAGGALGTWWVLGTRNAEHAAARAVTPVAQAVTPAPVDVPTSTLVPPESLEPATSPSAPLSALTITEHGVGKAIRNRELVDEATSFQEGDQVWFWTRVEDGNPGESIDHVWLRDGVEASRTTLNIGGSSWRTHSAKSLQAGTAGHWAVEARDATGGVLARDEFTVID